MIESMTFDAKSRLFYNNTKFNITYIKIDLSILDNY